MPGNLQFSTTTYSVDESVGTATITVTRADGNDGAVSVNYATSDGSATAGSDYIGTSGTLDWADGDATHKTFTVTINNDGIVEADETITLTLSGPTGGATLGEFANATLTVMDNDVPQPGTLQFSSFEYTVDENGGTATITVIRTGGYDGAVSVNYATGDETATAGNDYSAAAGTLNWADGDAADKTFTVPITDDGVVEGEETVNLILSGATGGATLGGLTLGGSAYATLIITDNDVAQPGTLQFSSATYNVDENGATATITATRTGGSDGAVSVNFATSNGSATAGSDYSAASGTLDWTDGDAANKTFTVAIIDDTAVEGDETVDLALSAPSGGATLGGTDTAVLTIMENDVAQPGTIQFSSATYSVNENGVTATITATRTGGSDGAVSVSYATSNGSATAGSDYTAASGTLDWTDGDAAIKIFAVAIIDDATVEGEETVNLALTSPTGGANLGGTDTASLTITDDDRPPRDDGDGIDTTIEVNAPNAGDGNGDGTPDSQQGNVTSLMSATGPGYLTLETTGACNQNMDVAAIAEAVADPGYDYPYGLVAFELPCSTATVRVYFHGTADLSGYTYRKYGPVPPSFTTPQWYTLPGVTFGTALIGGQSVAYAEFTLNDGQLGDDTGVDGRIVDQGGPGQPRPAGSVMEIPTLSEWGAILMAFSIVLVSLYSLRRTSFSK